MRKGYRTTIKEFGISYHPFNKEFSLLKRSNHKIPDKSVIILNRFKDKLINRYKEVYNEMLRESENKEAQHYPATSFIRELVNEDGIISGWTSEINGTKGIFRFIFHLRDIKGHIDYFDFRYK